MPTVEVNGKSYELGDNEHLENWQDWDRDIGGYIAEQEGIDMTDAHWEVVDYLREEYAENNSNQPMERVILKEMGKRWGKKVSSKDMYKLFPLAPSKQGNKIAGLPQVIRKGGY